jgi:hypothetical protein
MSERWKKIKKFPGYSVSDTGLIRSDKSDRLMSLYENQYGVVCVGLMRDGVQRHRSVPLLVAKAFLPRPQFRAFDTPINVDGDRHNNHVDNLAWRPRWFAVKYNHQFKHPHPYPIREKIVDLNTGEVSRNSFECARRYGLLETDLILSIINRTYVWPTYQEFGVVD